MLGLRRTREFAWSPCLRLRFCCCTLFRLAADLAASSMITLIVADWLGVITK